MASTGQSMRPAHPSGPTFLSYTPNGRKLVTVGSNNTIRVFETGSDDEPTNIDHTGDSFTAVVAANDFFITGSEDGTVCKFSSESSSLDEILLRATLPIRDLALSPDKQWVAVASDELLVKVINVYDLTRVRYIRDLHKPIKHLCFDFNGAFLMASCTDGNIYVYEMMKEEPELLRKIDALIPRLETDVQASSAVVWHPDGRAFASPTATRDVQVMAKRDWEKQRAFSNGHSGDITSLIWSPNGALLATAAMDRKICLWDSKSQKVLKRFEDLRAPIWAFAWHPTENILSYTNSEGELHIHSDFVPQQHMPLLEKGLQPAPFIHDPLQPVSGNVNRQPVANAKNPPQPRARRAGTPDSLDEILGQDGGSDLEGFVEDDDGEGYAEQAKVNAHNKRPNGDVDHYLHSSSSKRRALFQAQIHEAFQPGSTPWRGNRRYLCLNLIGFVWTLDQDTHHTVTVEFYDREFHRDFHFTDPLGYDKACLTTKGTLFSSQPKDDSTPASIFYRPHQTWTSRTDARFTLPKGESITSLALSDRYIIVSTSTNYLRIYTLFGIPVSIHRHKPSSIVSCAAWKDYLLTLGNGPIGPDAQATLTYSIHNLRTGTLLQNEDTVALPPSEGITSAFFADDDGIPFVYDTTGTLLALSAWRTPGAASWAPLLDTKTLSRGAGGRKQETYFPVAVSGGRFHCCILKGGDKYPYFPRPLLSEFEFEIPLSSPASSTTADGKAGKDVAKDDTDTSLEARHILQRTLLTLSQPPSNTQASHSLASSIARRGLEMDKLLLQMLAAECVEGEHTGMKCMELVGLMKDRTGRMLEAAKKVAGRFGREGLRERVGEVEERRVVGLDAEGDDADEDGIEECVGL